SLWFFFFSSRRRHTRFSRDWSSDVCSSDLHRLRVLEQVDPPRLLQEQAARNKRAVHQRPGIVGKPGIKPGHQRPEIDLEHDEDRSEERRVGKEGRTRWSQDHKQTNKASRGT